MIHWMAFSTSFRGVPRDDFPTLLTPGSPYWTGRGPSERSRLGRTPTGRASSGPNPGLNPHPSEQSGLRFGDDYDFCVTHRHTKLIQSKLGCFFDGFTGDFYPLHALSSLSCPLGSFNGKDALWAHGLAHSPSSLTFSSRLSSALPADGASAVGVAPPIDCSSRPCRWTVDLLTAVGLAPWLIHDGGASVPFVPASKPWQVP